MIKIITIEREYGCGGGEMAQSLAKHLGWKLRYELLTEEIAGWRIVRRPVEAREERRDRSTTVSSNPFCVAVMRAVLIRPNSTCSIARVF